VAISYSDDCTCCAARVRGSTFSVIFYADARNTKPVNPCLDVQVYVFVVANRVLAVMW
jgi:hypothetical protein